MSTNFDPAKLKVVELRAELSSRGLDTKGNKAVLVKRLKDALEDELEEELPDTSIADTSTEDINTSITEDTIVKNDNESPVKEPPLQQKPEIVEVIDVISKVDNKVEEKVVAETKVELEKEVPELKENDDKTEPVIEKMEVTETMVKIDELSSEEKQDELSSEEKLDELPTEEKQDDEEIIEKVTEKTTDDAPVTENGESEDQENSELKSRKSRWGTTDTNKEPAEFQNEFSGDEQNKKPDEVSDVAVEHRGDKRKHSSTSPERSQRRRSRSPIKENEPALDSDKVQLSWYDCDLHLQIDKNSFLSAHPYHDGGFGYIWSGVRATHGVNEGKICYEVKITEALKWEDIVKQHDKNKKKKTDEKNKKSEESTNNSTVKKNVPDKSPSETTDTGSKEGENDSEKIASNNESEEQNIKLSEEQNIELDESISKEQNDETITIEEAEADSQEDTQPSETKTETADDVEQMEVDEIKEPENESIPTHVFRVGWSLGETSLQLGEVQFSYAYESSAKFVTEKQFSDYGVVYNVGDVIGSYIEINENEVSITYTVNGEEQPVAITVLRTDLPEEFCLFPHILSRNYSFELNLGGKEEPWFSHPHSLSDYTYLDKAENKIAGPVRIEKRSDCEVIMMCGLPASGKTHWVQEWIKNNPEKKYVILGLDHLLERCTVDGNSLREYYKKSWNVVVDKLQKCVNKLVEVAGLRRRNFIIDQTNIFSSAQRRKMRPFEGFKRRAVVVIVGDEEQAKRRALQEAQDGKDVPDIAEVLEMKGNMHIPRISDGFDEVIFAELNEEESKATVQKYNTQGREAGYGPIPHLQRKDSRDDRSSHRWYNNRRNDNRGSYRERNYYHRYDNNQRSGWYSQRSGGWNRNDRRDNRGPPPSRDWRNNRGGNNRQQDNRSGNRDRNQGGSYNRNRNQQVRSQQNWQTQGNWSQGQGGPWSQGGWQQGQGWNQQGGWSGGQGQWKYGQQQSYTQGYGNYPNWNYYGQYAQNWSNTPQGQTQGGQGASQTANSGSGGAQYGQYAQQAAWAQYAQQYVQGQNNSASTQSPQK